MDVNAKGAIKKQVVRNFKHAWLDEDIFKGWLAFHPSENKAYCNACNKTIRCTKTDLIKHSQPFSHIQNVRSKEQSLSRDTSNAISHTEKVKSAEIKLAAFFAEHNIAFSSVDHLIPLIKNIAIEPEVVKNLSLGRTKCANIVEEVLAKQEVEKIVKILQKRKFSILLDENTDISETKLMCVLV